MYAKEPIQLIVDPPSAEEALASHVDVLSRDREGMQALHVHLSALRAYNRREHHITLAVDAFASIVDRLDGSVFRLASCDLIVTLKGATTQDLEDAALRLSYLFSEDPLSESDGSDGGPVLCSWYDLEEDFASFWKLTQEICSAAPESDDIGFSTDEDGEPVELRPLEPLLLEKLESALSQADIANMVRRQPICVITGKHDLPVKVFDESYLSIPELQNTLAPDVDIESNRWLFQHLTRTLDRRMLSMLTHERIDAPDRRFSVNLNASTVLSNEFLVFDDRLRKATRGTVAIELSTVDAFADMHLFLAARDFLRGRGYQVALDGVSFMMLHCVDRETMDLDLVKVQWDAGFVKSLDESGRERIRSLVAANGTEHVILCHCDNQDSIDIGRSLGITLFQGFAVDAILGAAAMSDPRRLTMRQAMAMAEAL